MFLDGRFGETDEDDDAVPSGVAHLWGDVDVETGFPVVQGPDVASLVDEAVSLAM